jgi:hypothetical protein
MNREWHPEGVPTRSFMIDVKRKSSLLKDICRFSIFSKKKYSKRSMYTLYYTNVHQIHQKLMNMSNRKELDIFNNEKSLARLLSEYRSQNLKDNYKFDLNLHWMMMVRYIYDGAVSSIRELKVLSSRIEWYTYIYICDNMLAIGKIAMSLRFKLHFVDGVLCYARVYSSVQSLANFNPLRPGDANSRPHILRSE